MPQLSLALSRMATEWTDCKVNIIQAVPIVTSLGSDVCKMITRGGRAHYMSPCMYTTQNACESLIRKKVLGWKSHLPNRLVQSLWMCQFQIFSQHWQIDKQNWLLKSFTHMCMHEVTTKWLPWLQQKLVVRGLIGVRGQCIKWTERKLTQITL